MIDPSTEERLAASKARQGRKSSTPRPSPWNRVVAGGASVVSFASMIVAMGPIFASAGSTEAVSADQENPVPTDTSTGAVLAIPAAPPVEIRPLVVQTDAQQTPSAQEPSIEAEATPSADPPPVPPATPAPTAAPTTAPPTTAPPATAPATTPARPETAPPRSDGSGG